MIMPRNVFSDFSRNIFRPASTCRRQQHGVSLTKRKKAEGMAVKLTVEPSRGGGASVVGAAVSQRRTYHTLPAVTYPGSYLAYLYICHLGEGPLNAAVGESF
ncbi:hypothetical protein CLOM_g13367 [Closterium sp. NIES-68]|nr:hypothetical protein CLOM_g13367 [Closterium sp. NIES-68]